MSNPMDTAVDVLGADQVTEKIVIEDDLPPIEESEFIADPDAPVPPKPEELVVKTGPKQGKNAQGDYVFGKDEVRKEIKTELVTGDKAYVNQGHGTVLIQDTMTNKDQPLEKHDYYMKGYAGQQRDGYGGEAAKNYELGREADMLGRTQAPEFVQVKTEAPTIGPRKQLETKTKKKKAKVVESLGCEKYPERLATPAGRRR
jgi:hypothetical protein